MTDGVSQLQQAPKRRTVQRDGARRPDALARALSEEEESRGPVVLGMLS
jgi:hypothetical protein